MTKGNEMIARAESFTTSGIVSRAQTYICGGSISGFATVDIYDGIDTNGTFVSRMSGEGEHHFGYEIICKNGLYLDCAGTGKVAVWLV